MENTYSSSSMNKCNVKIFIYNYISYICMHLSLILSESFIANTFFSETIQCEFSRSNLELYNIRKQLNLFIYYPIADMTFITKHLESMIYF